MRQSASTINCIMSQYFAIPRDKEETHFSDYSDQCLALRIFYRFDWTNWTVEWQAGIKHEPQYSMSYMQARITEGSNFAFGAILHSPVRWFVWVSHSHWFGNGVWTPSLAFW